MKHSISATQMSSRNKPPSLPGAVDDGARRKRGIAEHERYHNEVVIHMTNQHQATRKRYHLNMLGLTLTSIAVFAVIKAI